MLRKCVRSLEDDFAVSPSAEETAEKSLGQDPAEIVDEFSDNKAEGGSDPKVAPVTETEKEEIEVK